MKKLSVVIPAHNEQDSIFETVTMLHSTLERFHIDHEIIVVNDHSSDSTAKILDELGRSVATLKTYNNDGKAGFGYAIRYGLDRFRGDCVAIMMAEVRMMVNKYMLTVFTKLAVL